LRIAGLFCSRLLVHLNIHSKRESCALTSRRSSS
jgi:hypothetical protein